MIRHYPPKRIPEGADQIFVVDEHGKVIPIIPYEGDDEPIHTLENPIYTDPTCICQPKEAS